MTTVERLDFDRSKIVRTYRISALNPAHAVPPPGERDLRLDLFCGLANWFVFLDHIPNNIVNGITIRNFGFSGAADWFVFISGYTTAMLFARMMLERGFLIGATRIFNRTWQLYCAYVVLFVTYIVTIGYVAAEYAVPDIIGDFNLAGLIDHPIRILVRGLMLQVRPRNLDVLQLFILLMAFFPPVLWLMLRRPNLVMIGSMVLYFVARRYDWNSPSFPDEGWYFNPFCWQLFFVLGAWFALGGGKPYRAFLKLPVLTYVAATFLVFALVITMAGHLPLLAAPVPEWLIGTFNNPDDKANLAPYRVVHFIVLAYLVIRFVPKQWSGLQSWILKPAIKCGEQSVAVFCIGVFLSFVGHFVLITNSVSLLMQLFVSAAGIAVMTLVAYCVSWSEQ